MLALIDDLLLTGDDDDEEEADELLIVLQHTLMEDAAHDEMMAIAMATILSSNRYHKPTIKPYLR